MPQEPPPPRVPRQSGTRVKSPLVLLVDDYEDNLDMYGAFLRHAGIRVEEARDGEQAIARAIELLPNVIVMDLAMPILDGWEATLRLKADARTRDIPIICLSAHPHEARARAAGCQEFLKKPCPPDVLLQAIARVATSAGKVVRSGNG